MVGEVEKDAFPCQTLYGKVRGSIHLGMRKIWIPICRRCLTVVPHLVANTPHMHIIVYPDSDTSDIKYSHFQALSHCDQQPLLSLFLSLQFHFFCLLFSTFPWPLSTSESPVCFSHCIIPNSQPMCLI